MERLFIELNEQEDYAAQLFAQGVPKKIIAVIMFKSPNTIYVQLNSAYQKLGIDSQSDLIYLYLERKTGLKLRKSEEELKDEYRNTLKIPKTNIKHISIVLFFLMTSFFDGAASTIQMTRPRYRNINRVEYVSNRFRRVKQNRDFDISPLLTI